MDFITEDYMRKQGFEIVDSDTKDYGGGRKWRKWRKTINKFRDVEFIHLDKNNEWTLCDKENRLHCKNISQLNLAMQFIGVDLIFPITSI